jgi:serine/threonine-protein kinase
MATGDLPFKGATPAEVMHGHVKKPLEFTKAQQAKLSVATIFILRKAMEKDPADRYETPQAMLDDIRALGGPLIEARGPVPDVVHEASVEAAPITIPAPRPAGAHRPRSHARPHSRIHRRPHR